VQSSAVHYSEPIAVQDVFATGLARIEEAGGNLRLTFYTDQLSLFTNEPERVIVARLVIPITEFLDMRPKVTMALAGMSGAVGNTYIDMHH